jgi:hypothetical protein
MFTEPRHATIDDLLWVAELSSLYNQYLTKVQILDYLHGLYGKKFILIWDKLGYVIFSKEDDVLLVEGIAVVPEKLGTFTAGRIGQYLHKVAKDTNCRYIKGVMSPENPMTNRLIKNKKYDIIGYVVQREVV